ncbi:glycosyltransferase [Bradyrhizobium sp. JYMT SZCCT0180]|uniref:glycosyltransferase n=1 Tax=Bradyrhizobium sp. JYMT SZCCT0180 TaxID=2807666 RepID=UPI001BA7A588|nr:glycosyltransferase [Bradyrhizobium sp. JYMT SZCCT0180]MBR1214301.1 glycosyltransferase [Bradyrhizobium sp. JYMT SZCCT0180]
MPAVATPPSNSSTSPHKEAIRKLHDELAPERNRWLRKAAFFHSEDLLYLKFLIPTGSRILELGCGTGHLLAALKPSHGVGVDISSGMIEQARQSYPDLTFLQGDIEDPTFINSLSGPFDVILIMDTLGVLGDCQQTFANLHQLCGRETRLIVVYFSHLWKPILKLAELVRLRKPQPPQNVFSPQAVHDLVALADFEAVKAELRMLSPLWLLGIGRFLNRFVAPVPGLRSLCLRHYTVCRSLVNKDDGIHSATVVVPARNERGNIEQAVLRIPQFCDDIEIIFVEGHSRDGTWEEIQRVMSAYPQHNIKAMRQPGKGKADAVFAAFDVAQGDVLMILDADLTMPPEQLPKFWEAIRSGKGEYINGSRLIYQMEDEAMQFLNLIANKLFSIIFTWLLSQRFTDTLCGTKVLRRSDYEKLKAGRAYFGDFDPFGDFDIIFGASKLGLKVVEIPIRYANRTYGETQISRFRHGVLLLRMVAFAFFRIKAL